MKCPTRYAPPVAVALALSLPALAQQDTSPVSLTDTRDMRFCEILVIKDGMVDIYNTSGLNECPASDWNSLDPEAVAQEMAVDAIQKNGPHYWVMDEQILGFGETRTFNGIDARWAARISAEFLGGDKGSTPYETFKTCKTQKMTYEAGRKVYEMIDADGNAYILQAHEKEFSMDDLDRLDSKMKSLPEGWSWRSRELSEPLVLDLKAEICNIGIGDEFHQYYTLLPSGG